MGVIPFEQFQSILNDLAGGQLSPHEIRTLARQYMHRQEENVSAETLIAAGQEQLRKVNFESFSKIVDQCAHHDPDR